jgi:hypothetical protein
MMQSVAPTGTVGRPMVFFSESSLNGDAEIGVGTTTNGSDWAWNGIASTTPAAVYGATGGVWMTAGRYYYGARWACPYEAGTLTVYGLTTNGETDLTTVDSASQSVIVTNSPCCAAAWNFEANSTIPYWGSPSGTVSLASGLTKDWSQPGIMRVNGFPSGSGDKSRYVTFSATTDGKVDVGCFMHLVPDADGPRTVDLQYTVNGSSWENYLTGVALPDQGGYLLGGMPGDTRLNGNPKAAFRLIGYNAPGTGALGFEEVEIAAYAPEPAATVVAVFALAALMRRRVVK